MTSVCIKTISNSKVNYLNNFFKELPIKVYISNHRFKIYDNVIIHYKEKEDTDKFYELVAIAIKNLIKEYYEEDLIIHNLDSNYFYLSNLERKYILEITKKVLEFPDEKIGNINNLLVTTIKNYIFENNKIIIEGFVNFRIKEYVETLDYIAELAVTSYLELI